MTTSFYDAPMALDDNLTRTRAFQPEEARGRMDQNVNFAYEYVLGPMPRGEFADAFLAKGDKQMLTSKDAFSAVPASASAAQDVHGKLLAALNKTTKRKGRCPGFVFANLPSKVGLDDHAIACYALHTSPAVSPNDVSPTTALGFAELIVTTNADPVADPFFDRPDRRFKTPFLSRPMRLSTDAVLKKLGYHIDLISELFARQHREFVFSVSVFGSRARLLRWDRAGCVATESFDLHAEPETLCEFLWRFSHTSDAGRGHDTSIGATTRDEEALFKEAITRRVAYELDISGDELIKAVSEHYAPGRVVAVHVPTVTGPARRFIISRPVVSPSSATGRCTRGYWAVDASSHEVVFIKDTWRSGHVHPEGDVISRLLAAGVRNVPSLICHGDVEVGGRVQVTATDGHQRRKWCARPRGQNLQLPTLVHYRMVLGTVGYGLSRFRGTEELLHGTYDAYQAMLDAYDKDARLHRDISLGNILLVKEPGRAVRRGYLIDWEVSSQVDSEGKSLDHARAGTWFYMAWEIALRPLRTRHELRHDMESLIWIVFYCGLRWLPHSYEKHRLAHFIDEFFVQVSFASGIPTGGSAKYDNTVNRTFTDMIIFDGPVQEWLSAVLELHCPRGDYDVICAPEWEDPVGLDVFWAVFLENALPAHDRVDNGVYRRVHPFEPLSLSVLPPEAPSVTQAPPSIPWIPSSLPPSPKKRRGREDDESRSALKLKRRKQQPSQEDAAAPAAARRHVRSGSRSSRTRTTANARNAVVAEPRYSLRPASEVVSQYRQAYSR